MRTRSKTVHPPEEEETDRPFPRSPLATTPPREGCRRHGPACPGRMRAAPGLQHDHRAAYDGTGGTIMSKKILILNGSPRSKGNTAMLCDAFSAGARSAGHQVTRFDLHKLDIHSCLGCVKGGKDPASPCVQKDDMGLIYPVYREADLVVLASPMYYWGFSGQLKTAFDRLFAVAECFPGYANPHKECALVMAAEGDSADNWKPVLDYYHALLGFLGWKDRGQVLAGGVFEAGAVAGQPVLDQAFRFGASL